MASSNTRKISASRVLAGNEIQAAVLAKLIRPKATNKSFNRHNKQYLALSNDLDMAEITKISEDLKKRNKNIDDILALFPEIEMIKLIMTSSILAPRNLTTTNIMYAFNKNTLPVIVQNSILTYIKEYIDSEYGLKEEMEAIIKDVLFNVGSYVKVVIPESSLDDIVNNRYSIDHTSIANEAANLDILGTTNGSYNPRVTLEDGVDTLISIHDNFSLLKTKMYIDNSKVSGTGKAIRSTRSTQVTGTEDISDKQMNEIYNYIYKNTSIKNISEEEKRKNKYVEVPTKDRSSRRSVGKPLVMKIPSCAVIPVHVPSDPSDTVGCFVLLDAYGDFITDQVAAKNLDSLSEKISRNEFESAGEDCSISQKLIEKARKNIAGKNPKNRVTLSSMSTVFSKTIEKELMERVKLGTYGREVAIDTSDHIYKIMLARTLSHTETRMIYVPKELITYFAIDYANNGTGVSLIDKAMTTLSMRATLKVAKITADIKNNIDVTKVHTSLDENDIDPKKTMEMIMHEVMRVSQYNNTLGLCDVSDILDYIQRAGFSFTFDNHPGIPSTKIDFDHVQPNIPTPDSSMMDDLEKSTHNSLGITSEMVDAGMDGNFATTVIANNHFLAKRILLYQISIMVKVSKYVRSILKNDYIAREYLFDILKENKTEIVNHLELDINELESSDVNAFYEVILDEVIDTLDLSLPAPAVNNLESQREAYDQYKEAVEDLLETYYPDDLINIDDDSAMPELERVRSLLLSHLLREWSIKNGYLTEVCDVINPSTLEELDIPKEIGDFTKAVGRFGLNLNVHQVDINKQLESLETEKLKKQVAEMNNKGTDDSEETSDDENTEDEDIETTDDTTEEDSVDEETTTDEEEDIE